VFKQLGIELLDVPTQEIGPTRSSGGSHGAREEEEAEGKKKGIQVPPKTVRRS